MSFSVTNIALVIKHNGVLYYFYTWTSDEYFYEKKSFCVNFYGTVLYVPCIPVDNETLKNYSHTIRVKFNNALYSFLGANKSLAEHQTNFNDVFYVHSDATFSDGSWKKSVNTFYIKISTAQRIGMRYKYYLRQLTDEEANNLGYLSTSDTVYIGKTQYAGYSTFTGEGKGHGGLSEITDYDITTIELVNSEQTANLIGGIYTYSWEDVNSPSPSRVAVAYTPCNIACYRITGDAMDGYMDFTISYKESDYNNHVAITFYNNGVKKSTGGKIDIPINYSTLAPKIN